MTSRSRSSFSILSISSVVLLLSNRSTYSNSNNKSNSNNSNSNISNSNSNNSNSNISNSNNSNSQALFFSLQIYLIILR
ncbi:hypothetical protein CLOM_g5487 [Closterium sp. NIES-68]|nr:hypothetical protein CLOM_g5487 [Closterium sp. NIES-68]